MTDPKESVPTHRDYAAELALGILTGADKAYALRLQLSDPAFAEEVAAWQERLGPLYAEIQDIEPPASVWQRFETGRTAPITQGRPAYRAVRVWKAAAVAASLLAASLALVLFYRPAPHPPVAPSSPPVAVALLTGLQKQALVTLVYEPSSGTLRSLSSGLPAGGKVPELWLIGPDGRPRSLGIVAKIGSSSKILPRSTRALLTQKAVLAISLETVEGAPHRAPGTPPILTGKMIFF